METLAALIGGAIGLLLAIIFSRISTWIGNSRD